MFFKFDVYFLNNTCDTISQCTSQFVKNVIWFQATYEWFKIYKIPDGKPENKFAFNGEAKNKVIHILKKTTWNSILNVYFTVLILPSSYWLTMTVLIFLSLNWLSLLYKRVFPKWDALIYFVSIWLSLYKYFSGICHESGERM